MATPSSSRNALPEKSGGPATDHQILAGARFDGAVDIRCIHAEVPDRLG